jgi:hypothetical protein
LANILGCGLNDLIAEEELISENIPLETNLLLKNLYLRQREDILQIYATKLRDFQLQKDLRKMVQEAHRLFLLFTEKDSLVERAGIEKAVRVIADDFPRDNCLCNSQFTGYTSRETDILYERLAKARGAYHADQVWLIFAYVSVIFDAIVQEECVASAAQLMPERSNNKASQYAELTQRSERIRDTLMELVVYKGLRLDGGNAGLSVEEMGLDTVIIDGIILMLGACEKCFQHLEGDYTQSEYVNRAGLDAILKHLERVFRKLGVKLQDKGLIGGINTLTSRFGRNYYVLKGAFQSLRPPRPKPKSYRDGYEEGQNDLLRGAAWLSLMN